MSLTEICNVKLNKTLTTFLYTFEAALPTFYARACYTLHTDTHPHALGEVQRCMFGKMEWWNPEACLTVKGDDYTG